MLSDNNDIEQRFVILYYHDIQLVVRLKKDYIFVILVDYYT